MMYNHGPLCPPKAETIKEHIRSATMEQNRRNFLQGAGAVCAIAATGRLTVGHTEPKPASNHARGMARGLTLLTVRRNGEYGLGVKTDKGILDVNEASKLLHLHTPATMDDLLQNEDGPSLNALVDAASKSDAAQKAFVKEEGIQYGPVMIIGREAKNVSEADALSYVAGYCTGNDFTARDLQLETGGQWMIGKTPDQFAPLGPYLVTAEQVEPNNLKIECRANGETRQSSNTSDMIFNCRQIISYISRHITLKPGDIVFTGTPEGVIQGHPKDKQVWLKPGDKIACSLEKLGELKFELV